MKAREVTFIMIALVLGAVIGGLIGDIIGSFLEPGGAKTLFTKRIEVGIPTFQADFFAIWFVFGVTFRINFVSVLMVILVIVYFRWWYL